jgi:hypothetical protein
MPDVQLIAQAVAAIMFFSVIQQLCHRSMVKAPIRRKEDQ